MHPQRCPASICAYFTRLQPFVRSTNGCSLTSFYQHEWCFDWSLLFHALHGNFYNNLVQALLCNIGGRGARRPKEGSKSVCVGGGGRSGCRLSNASMSDLLFMALLENISIYSGLHFSDTLLLLLLLLLKSEKKNSRESFRFNTGFVSQLFHSILVRKKCSGQKRTGCHWCWDCHPILWPLQWHGSVSGGTL